ncbi:hypothetical protein [Flavobacterium sp.]|uniref:hypothetical protein n=1 Tax=Flavobacterium sp. TaxID=239 RepID=UPI003C371F6B
MKTIKLLAIGILFAASSAMQAQVSVNLNIGTRSAWRPAPVQTAVDFYYIPEVRAYYDNHAGLYVYYSSNNWVRSRYLPTQYRNVNIDACHRVALNGYRGNRPYEHYSNHRAPQQVAYRAPQQVVYVERDHHYDKHDYKHYDKHYDKHDKKHHGKH